MDIYLGDNPVPLRINSQHDLAPYYPYIVVLGGWADGRGVFRLTERSFVDTEEEEHLNWKLRDFKKYRRRCKRNKVEYDEEQALKAICWFPPTDVDREIAHRVGVFGEKATIVGLNDPIHEYYRSELFSKMIELGWDERRARYWIWKDWTIVQNKE